MVNSSKKLLLLQPNPHQKNPDMHPIKYIFQSYLALRHRLPNAFGLLSAILLTSVFGLPSSTFAQILLTDTAAVRIGLVNNYNIRLVKQDLAIAANNNTLGNAGFLPEVNLTAGRSNSVTNAKQTFLTGQTNDKTGAKSDALTAGAQLNWTLFDGMQMFVRRDQLNLLEQQSELQLQQTIENSVYDILSNYYALVYHHQQLKVIDKSIEIDHERMQLSEQMLDIGAGSRLELLQAAVDLNADSAMYLNLRDQIAKVRTALNELLARDPATSFNVADSFELRQGLMQDQLLSKMLQQNSTLLLSRQSIELAALSLRAIKGRQIPTLGFNLGYNYNDQSSESGFLTKSTNSGITYGLNAQMTLFDGLNLRREKQNARLALETGNLMTESIESGLRATLHSHYNSYVNRLQLLRMESQNVLAARENLAIATERFKLGDLAGIEFREAQRNFMEAEGRLLDVKLQVKLEEINLLQLAGELVFR